MRSPAVVWAVLGAVVFYGTLFWLEFDNPKAAQAQARVQALQAQWREAQQNGSPSVDAGTDPARHPQQLLAELSAAGQAKQVRDDLLQLVSIPSHGLSWQAMQLDRQGVWQLQLRSDNLRALELWHQQIKGASLDRLEWVQMARSAPALAGKDAGLAAHEPQALLITLRAPLRSVSPQPTEQGDDL
jgi:hypothetical protein